jgi:hypothetical protein
MDRELRAGKKRCDFRRATIVSEKMVTKATAIIPKLNRPTTYSSGRRIASSLRQFPHL